MSLQEIAALLRRHLAAVLVVVAAAGGVGYYLKKSPQPYQDSCTVAFTSPPSANFPNPYSSFSETLIETAGLVAILVMNAQGQQEVRAAGGTGAYDVALVNSYNLEYPDFSSPDVTVTATGASPAVASQTFTVVTRQLERELTMRESQEGTPLVGRIGLHILGETGPVSQQGSSKRVFAGLLFLTIVAVFSVAGFLDRHPFRLRRLPGLRGLAPLR